MSVTIRLARIGRRNLPSFRLVVSNTKDKRNGKFLEILGYFNPSGNKVLFDYNKERFEYWKKNGALVTKSTQELVNGKYTFRPYKKTAEEKKERAPKEQKEKKFRPAEEVVEEAK
jgi:small subunit ribosomal protein S16